MGAGLSGKAALKRAVKRLAVACSWIPGVRQTGARILTYHSVGVRDHEMNVTPEAFLAQMEWLAEGGKVITLEQAASGITGVALTFDDGYRDVLLNAAPILARLRLPATVFVVAGRLGGMLDHDRDPVACRIVSRDELPELPAMGIAIGAHTMNHRRLSELNDPEQRSEIVGSVKRLEELLGHRIEAFAYPFGSARDYNATSVRLAQESGVALACSNRYGTNPPGADRWTLRRIWIDATDSLETMRAKVQGRLDGLRVLDSGAGVHARRLLNRLARIG